MQHSRRQVLASPTDDQGGSVLAESALVMPLLLMLIFAMIWFGMLIYTHLVVQMAANQGARAAGAAYAQSAQGSSNLTPEQQGQAMAYSVLKGGSLDANSICGIHLKTTQVGGQAALQATVCYRYNLLVPFMDHWGAATSGITVTHSSVYRKE